MILPVVQRPIYRTTILSKGEVEYMPFTVRESTLLMQARESRELKQAVDAVRQILHNCLVDQSIDVNKLPMVDLEWLFVQLFAKANGEKVPVFFKCENKVGEAKCGMPLEFTVDLTKVSVTNKDIDRKIKINEEIGMVMKLPTFEMAERIANLEDTSSDVALAAMCIEQIWDAQSVYNTTDADDDEVYNFVQGLPPDKLEAIHSYLENCPVIESKHTIECQKCKFTHNIILEGLEDHFG